MNTGTSFSLNLATTLTFAGLILGQQQVFAHEGAGNFRDFVAANPGIDRSALRQTWNNKMAGGSGIGFGVIMPGPGRNVEIPPVIKVSTPVMSNQVESFKQFRAQNPGIDGSALRQVWNSNDPARIGIMPIRSKPISDHDIKNEVISYGQFKELNQGIDKHALRQMYKHLKNGDPADVTIGVISFPPGSGPDSGAPPIPKATSILATQNAFGKVNLITGDK